MKGEQRVDGFWRGWKEDGARVVWRKEVSAKWTWTEDPETAAR
jgi:hypothetical protein